MSPAPGVLYVVATPIGNLEDLTFRALRTLKTVDLIAAEDTRRTAKLLAHYQIQKPVVSLREHNEAREMPRLVDRLLSGTNIALVSDAGTPAIADPGARLVRAARSKDLKIVPIPGPSAITAAVSVSGLSSDEFVFLGFPPVSGSSRRRFMEAVSQETRAVVLFEAPHRIERTLAELENVLVSRPIHVHREITKMNEEYVKRPSNVPKPSSLKGEFTVIVEPHAVGIQLLGPAPEIVPDIIGRLTNTSAFTSEEVAAIVSAVDGLSLQAAKRQIKKHMFSVKQRTQSST